MLKVYKGLFRFDNPKSSCIHAFDDIPASERVSFVHFTVKWDGHPSRVRGLLEDEFSARFGDNIKHKLLTIQKVAG